jgi:GcrA cell cycle regulator
MNTWSVEEDAALHQMWIAGQSGTQIGQALGRSRSAVLGRIFRLNVPKRDEPVPVRLSRRCGGAPKASLVETAAIRTRKIAAASPPPLEFIGRDFTQLGAGECRWIEGDPAAAHAWCGAPAVPASSYCEAHRRLCRQAGRAR